jgi:hypothetical protein
MNGSKWMKLLHPTPFGIMGEKPIPLFMGIGFSFYLWVHSFECGLGDKVPPS